MELVVENDIVLHNTSPLKMSSLRCISRTCNLYRFNLITIVKLCVFFLYSKYSNSRLFLPEPRFSACGGDLTLNRLPDLTPSPVYLCETQLSVKRHNKSVSYLYFELIRPTWRPRRLLRQLSVTSIPTQS